MNINFCLGELIDKLGTPVVIALILIGVGLVLLFMLLWKNTNPERTKKFAFFEICAIVCIVGGIGLLSTMIEIRPTVLWIGLFIVIVVAAICYLKLKFILILIYRTRKNFMVDSQSYEGHHYKLFKESVTWQTAKQVCEKMGGHLVTITSKGENDFVHGLVNHSGVSAWIGLVKSGSSWKWVTGEQLSYSNWKDTAPNTVDNVRMSYLNGKWRNDQPDRTSFYYVCEWDF